MTGHSCHAFRCSDAARSRQDPQLGTASQARRWLLIEHPGPWPVDAVAGSGIDHRVLDRLLVTTRTVGARPLLIRRPGGKSSGARRAWAVSYAQGVTRWGTWRHDGDLGEAAEALEVPSPDARADADPVLLVCAHGRHDACCAIRGRPVAAALAREWPAATWECSHVGGDRFAPNLVLLPDGVYYGLLDPDRAVDTVRAHLAGQLQLEHLRGIAQAPPPAQVAIAAVHERYGPLGAAAVKLVRLSRQAPGQWLVELATDVAGVGPLVARVAAEFRTPAQLTCRAAVVSAATDYRVVTLQEA